MHAQVTKKGIEPAKSQTVEASVIDQVASISLRKEKATAGPSCLLLPRVDNCPDAPKPEAPVALLEKILSSSAADEQQPLIGEYVSLLERDGLGALSKDGTLDVMKAALEEGAGARARSTLLKELQEARLVLEGSLRCSLSLRSSRRSDVQRVSAGCQSLDD
eukprot:753067-Hanusia_phi.AAC.7